MIALFLLAVQMLGFDMSPEDMKNTGMNKLNDPEKMALQQWIDAHYDKKAVAAPALPTNPAKAGKLSLSENLLSGRYVRLSDGTLWNIRPQDTPIVQGWITPADIVVSPSDNSFYPFKLTNQISGSSVLARKADKLPPAGSSDMTPPSSPVQMQPPAPTK